MSILKVAQLGNPVLRTKAEPVLRDIIHSDEIQGLIDDMIDTMREYNGAGLAAPQVHEPLQIIVLEAENNPRYKDDPDVPLTIVINPKIVSFSDEMEEGWEGCLSLNDLWGLVNRAVKITVTGFDRNGDPLTIEAEGFFARALQHEIDHLHAKVFIDRMTDLTSLSFGKEYQRYHREYDEEAEE
jgi:peptide deformylase